MRTTTADDIVAALERTDPAQLAATLAGSSDPAFAHLARAVLAAADHKAAYPRADVLAEADALLYDVLRWPVADASPTGITIDPATVARHRRIPVAEAERLLDRIRATESVAADELIASGVNPNFTLEHAQVYDCIVTLRTQQRVPTRQLVREHATRIAASAMRPEDGDVPLVYSAEPSLAPRIVSPSPKVHVLLWLGRMDADPPAPGVIADRIAYVIDAKAAIGGASQISAGLPEPHAATRSARAPSVERRDSLRLVG